MKKSMRVFLGLVLLSGGFFIYKMSGDSSSPLDLAASQETFFADADGDSRAPASVSSMDSTGSSVRSAEQIFKDRLEADPEAKELYLKTLSKLGDGEEADLVALYVAGGLYGGEDPQFQEVLVHLQNKMNGSAEKIHGLLLQYDKELKEDSFIYQMVLNLEFNLNLDNASKAQLLGQALDQRFEIKDGEVSLSSANVTNAFILMKNAGLSVEDVAPYIEKGLTQNTDEKAQEEFLGRVRTYYPEYFER